MSFLFPFKHSLNESIAFLKSPLLYFGTKLKHFSAGLKKICSQPLPAKKSGELCGNELCGNNREIIIRKS